VIKLYAWEPAFQNRIEDIRNRELRFMRYAAYIGGFFEISWHSTALLVSLTFLFYFAHHLYNSFLGIVLGIGNFRRNFTGLFVECRSCIRHLIRISRFEIPVEYFAGSLISVYDGMFFSFINS
jgi:hypothetical protein